MHAVRFAVVVAAAVVVAGVAQGCLPECEHLADCPVGETCSAEKKCVDLCANDGTGPLSGRVFAPDGATAIIGASVVLAGAEQREVITDADGRYSFDDVPAGEAFVTAGRGRFFGTERTEICGAKENALDVKIKPPPHSMLVVPGDYDTIEAVLTKMGLGFEEHFDLVSPAQLRAPGALDGVDYVFFNCTNETSADDVALQETIRDFVQAGGTVYASDWAFEYVETIWPDAIDFPENPRIGVEGGFTAEVVDAELGAYLGKQTVSLQYDLGAWVVTTGVGAADVLVRGVYPFAGAGGVERQEGPLLIQFRDGSGTVNYTTFHNEAQATDDMDRILTYLVFAL